jgi:uncharacterized protein YjbI with pentapeptide repeats
MPSLSLFILTFIAAVTASAQLLDPPSRHAPNGASAPPRSLQYQETHIAHLVNGVCVDVQGRSAMNQRSGQECVDLKFTDQTNQYYVGRQMRGFNLSYVDAKNANLAGAHLSYSVIRSSSFYSANLINTELDHVDLRGTNLSGAKLNGARASGALFSGGHFRKTSFRNADLSLAKLISVYCELCDFQGADLRGADLSNSIFIKPRFEGAIINVDTKLPMTREQTKQMKMVFQSGS